MTKHTKNFLGIDLGASSGRGIVGAYDGEKLKLSEVHRFPNEPQMLCGRFTWDILRLYAEVKNAIRAATCDLCSMGIDTWGVDYGLLDAKGRLISNPVHYRDGRCAGIIPEFGARVMPNDKLYGITGIQLLEFNTVYQFYADVRDGTMCGARRALFVPDLLGWFLTGEQACEYTVASTGALIDASARDISTDIMSALGLERGFLAPLVTPGTTLGKLLPDVCAEVGRDGLRVVSIASHDTASAVLAVPVKKEERFVYISSGTWSLLGTELDAPVISTETLARNFTNEGGVGGRIRFLKNIMGLWLLQESRRQWKREGVGDDEISFDSLAAAAAQVPACFAVIDPDDPRFAAPGDMPRRIAEYCRQTDQRVPSTPGEIVRVIYDSLALCYRRTVGMISRLCGFTPSAVNIVGGGSRDELFNEIIADICEMPVVAGPTEATAVGNIAVQLMAEEGIDADDARELVRVSFPTQTYLPHSQRGRYDDAYSRFCAMAEARESAGER